MRRKHSLLRGFFDKGLKMHHAYGFFSSSFRSKPARNTGIWCFDKTKCKEQNVFKQFSHSFSSCFLDSRNQSFLVAVFFHRSSRLKQLLNRKKLPNWTKNWHLRNCLWMTIFFAWKRAPQAKVDLLLVPLERHALCTQPCGRIFVEASHLWSLWILWMHVDGLFFCNFATVTTFFILLWLRHVRWKGGGRFHDNGRWAVGVRSMCAIIRVCLGAPIQGRRSLFLNQRGKNWTPLLWSVLYALNCYGATSSVGMFPSARDGTRGRQGTLLDRHSSQKGMHCLCGPTMENA